jgi:hypothetical protein
VPPGADAIFIAPAGWVLPPSYLERCFGSGECELVLARSD